MISAINKIVIYVKDLEQTFLFYKSLGLDVAKTDNLVVITAGCTSIEAVTGPTDESMNGSTSVDIDSISKGEGIFLLLEVDNVDDYYKKILSEGIDPSTEPKTWKWGRREFVVRDPDKYRLVFYQNVD